MESLIRNVFEFCPESFGAFLTLMNGFIAGSSTLYAYLDMVYEARGPGCKLLDWTPGDLDVWIPIPGLSTELIHEERDSKYLGIIESPARTPASKTIARIAELFMEDHGWKRDYSVLRNNTADYLAFRESSPYIFRVFPFIKNKRKIQVIFTADVSPAAILDTFDLSGCKVAWSPTLGFDVTPADVREQLKRDDGRVLYLAPTAASLPSRTLNRIRKYQERYFTVMGDLKHFIE